jgi:hypothetical protein
MNSEPSPSSSMSHFTLAEIQKVQSLKMWVEAHKSVGHKVAVVFVNGILHDETPPQPFLNIIESYFQPDSMSWERNTFLSKEFVGDLLGKVGEWVSDPRSAVVAGIVGIGMLADAYFNAGRATSAIASALNERMKDLPSVARYIGKGAAIRYWGEHGIYTEKINQGMGDEDDYAFLFVGHSFGALSLATARPYLVNEHGYGMLLLGSPEDHSNLELESTVEHPIYAITHETDIIRMLSFIGDPTDLQQKLLRLDAHSLASYSQLFAAMS